MPTEVTDERSNASSSEDSEEVEWLATGRAKRSNAGNRLQAMLSMEENEQESTNAEDEEDEINALFKEDDEEPDEEFEDKDAEDDEGGGSSSSSDEDDRPQDELEGEKQLRKEEREKQQVQKRKADTRFVKKPQPKRVRISEPGRRAGDVDQTSKKKRKKSERQSWTLDESNQVRKSSRTLAVQNKERTRESLKESEAKRTRQMAAIEAARKRRLTERKGPMTQEDRLREAAEVEKKNARSLNRWQELEDERRRRQKQKLEALQNRKIDGPLIRWWSGPAEWQGDRLIRVGRPQPVHQESQTSVPDAQSKPDLPTKDAEEPEQAQQAQQMETAGLAQLIAPFASSAAHTTPMPSKTTTSFLEGIEQFASMPGSSPTAPPAQSSPVPTQIPKDFLVNPYTASPNPQPPSLQLPQLQQFSAGSLQLPPAATNARSPAPVPVPPPLPPVTALRSTLTLQNFDPIVESSTEAQRRIVFGLKTPEAGNVLKPPLPELCAITAARAKYRDPLTGLPYRGMAEFKRLRNLPGLESSTVKDGSDTTKAKWSNVLDAWVGIHRPAAGAPESFVTGTAAEPETPPQQQASSTDNVEVKPEQTTAAVA